MLTQERLKELLHYDPETGIFKRLVYRGGPIRETAGYLHKKGYIHICVDMCQYKAHRLAFLYMLGRWPNCEVDHEDRNRANNAWKNLREADDSEQARNASIRADNTSRVKGVDFNKRSKKWRARINVDGKSQWLGSFDTVAEAAAAYEKAARIFHGQFAHSTMVNGNGSQNQPDPGC